MEINKHFDDKSENYTINRNKGILGLIVKAEKLKVLEFLNINKNDFILDAGCGDGFYSIIIKEKEAQVLGLDISKDMIYRLNKRGIEGKVMNIENLNFKKKFDKILCAGAMEFLKKPKKAVDSFYNSLKNNGILVIQYPRKSLFSYLYKLYHKLHGINIKLFSKKEFEILVCDDFYIEKNENAGIISAVIKCVKK